MEARHDTVLLTEAIDGLAIEAGDVVVDGTIGGAGHFGSIYDKLGPDGVLIGIDADQDAIARAEARVAGKQGPRVMLANDNFRNLGAILDKAGAERMDRALFDLGWSGFHLESGRGFSFQTHEPLIMTYGMPGEGESAAELVNSATEEYLADVLYTYGEERFARGIAKSIVRTRKEHTIMTTDDLVAAVEAGTPSWYHHRRLHPATKTFQALRIAVNDELGAIREGLTTAIDRLACHGRIAVITFHSIEDRIVKQMFRDAAHAGKGSLVNRKPLMPSPEETKANPRARSAKLRIFSATPEGAAYASMSLVGPMAAISYL
ncbi:MAG TPA: 16S rRNA (cytosine(1402)-N(4))-methyltransferase RsmH [Candidatus Paceibacterota bacterium]|jgi:16S rRNA (cytosine1402-N4)-methyltransferase